MKRTDGPPASSSLQMVESLGASPLPDPDRGATWKSAVLIKCVHRTIEAALGHSESRMSSQLAAPDTAAMDVDDDDAGYREESTSATIFASCELVSTVLRTRDHTSLLMSSRRRQPALPQGQCHADSGHDPGLQTRSRVVLRQGGT